jgi:hypothetical protein
VVSLTESVSFGIDVVGALLLPPDTGNGLIGRDEGVGSIGGLDVVGALLLPPDTGSGLIGRDEGVGSIGGLDVGRITFGMGGEVGFAVGSDVTFSVA